MTSSAEKKTKKDKEIVLELETQIKEIRHQLNEQLRCVDQRFENHYCMVWELQDFYQRRAEVELEYARNLDKLVKQVMLRHRSEKQRREQWPTYSTYRLWQTLLGVTTKQSRCHSTLAEINSNVLTNKFSQCLDDMQRIYKKCRELAVGTHGELTKVVTELHNAMKTYHVYHEQSRQTRTKLERVQSEKVKIEQESKKNLPSKRVQRYEKQTEKHQNKFSESHAKATKARNEYILSMVSANASLRKFIVDDLPELINTMDYGYHVSLGQTMMTAVNAEQYVARSHQDSLELLASKAKELNQREDRQAFLQLNHQIFSLPKKFEFQPHKGDPECEVSASTPVLDDLTDRLNACTDRLHSLKLENEELWKTLETTDNAIMDRIIASAVDVASFFSTGTEKEPVKPVVDAEKQKSERLETEQFYFNKFRDYQNNNNLIARLQARFTVIEKALVSCKGGQVRPMSVMPKRKRPLGKYALEARPKLFGGSIEEYVQATSQEIPSIITSCTRIINLYGMHHQGVFRVSGAQHEINDFKSMFERGEEPLIGKVDSRDINSVAGVLKLYFRELQEPLFPVQLFDELISCSKCDVGVPDELKKCILRLQELLLPLPRPVVVVMRYLFSFLNHLSEYSDENMMDPYNIAVCFGPTLLPVPADRDQVRYQNYVNELIRILICYQEKIFPNDGGPVYERCIVEEDGDLEDSLDSLLEDVGPDGTGSEDDLDVREKEAIVLYDFQGRSSKELSLTKGDTVTLKSRVSPDWWEGVTSSGQKGLIANKFIAVQQQRRTSADKQQSVGQMHTSTESLPTGKAFSLTGSSMLTPVIDTTAPDPLDRSVSQPNIAADVALSVIVSPSPTAAVLASCSSTSSDLSRGGYASADSLGSLSSKDDLIDAAAPAGGVEISPSSKQPTTSTQSPTTQKMSTSWSLSIDEGLSERSPSLSTSLEPTPDLVLNLPTIIACSPLSTQMSVEPPLSPTITAAELFANAEHGTIKKNSQSDRGWAGPTVETDSSSVGGVGSGTFDEVFPDPAVDMMPTPATGDGFYFDLLAVTPHPLTVPLPADVNGHVQGISSDSVVHIAGSTVTETSTDADFPTAESGARGSSGQTVSRQLSNVQQLDNPIADEALHPASLASQSSNQTTNGSQNVDAKLSEQQTSESQAEKSSPSAGKQQLDKTSSDSNVVVDCLSVADNVHSSSSPTVTSRADQPRIDLTVHATSPSPDTQTSTVDSSQAGYKFEVSSVSVDSCKSGSETDAAPPAALNGVIGTSCSSPSSEMTPSARDTVAVTAESGVDGTKQISVSASAGVNEAGSTFTADSAIEGTVVQNVDTSTILAPKPVAEEVGGAAGVNKRPDVDTSSSDVVAVESFSGSKIADPAVARPTAVIGVAPEADIKQTSAEVPETTGGGNKPIVRRTSIKTLPQTTPPAVSAAIGSSTTAAAGGGAGVESGIDVPPVPRPAPSLHAHTAVLEMLTKQHDNSTSASSPTTAASDKPKARPPPPVMKKPTKPQTGGDIARPQ